jgi:TolB-like protein
VGLSLALVLLLIAGGWALWWGISEHAVAGLDESRIAVLPLTNLSAEVGQVDFADRMTYEVIAQLAQIRGLTVSGRPRS